MVKCLPSMWETQVQSLVWEDSLEKEMAIYSSILAWKTSWMEEPGRLQSMWLQELDTTKQLHFSFPLVWRRKWQPTTVFLLGKSHGWRSLVGYNPWGHKESDMTEQLHFHFPLVA